MVFLALTPAGLKQALTLAQHTSMDIWCGADAMTEAETSALQGRNVSWFNYTLADASADVIQGAVETIAEHHPNQTIWVEQLVRL